MKNPILEAALDVLDTFGPLTEPPKNVILVLLVQVSFLFL